MDPDGSRDLETIYFQFIRLMNTNSIDSTIDCPCGRVARFGACCEQRDDLERVLEEWVDHGYDHAQQDQEEEAAMIWWRAWKLLEPDLDASVTDFDALDERYDFVESSLNWIGDTRMAFRNGASDDRALVKPAISFHRDVLEQFPDVSDLFWKNTMMNLAKLYQWDGDFDRAVKQAEKIIEQHPEAATGYAALSDLYEFADPPDYERAAEILEEGLERVSEQEAKSYGFTHRLQYCQDQI